MRIFRIAAFCVSGTIWAQVAPLPPSTGDSAIEGIAVEAVTGKPVRKAVVRLTGTVERRATSGEDGRFVFDKLPEGGYGVQASRRAGMVAPIVPVQLAKSDKVRVVVKIVAPAAVFGRVLDEDGDPIIGAMVSLLRVDYSQGKPQLVPVESASTDDHGEYRIHSVTPGRYRVQADAKVNLAFFGMMPRRYSRTEQPDEVPYATMCHPNTRDASAAAIVKLGPGAEFRADFRMEKQKIATISGRIAGVSEDPTGISVLPVPCDSDVAELSMHSVTRWNDDGTFTITGVPPGRYWVVAATTEHGLNEAPLAGITPVDTTLGPVAGVTVALTAGTEITGRLRFEGEIDTQEQRRMMLTPAGVAAHRSDPSPADVDGEGRFRISSVVPGVWNIHPDLVPPGGFVKSMKFGGQDVLGKGLEIGIDGRTAGGELEIVVSTKGARIEGMVSGSMPGIPVQVIAMPEGDKRWIPTFLQMDVAFEDGRYRVEGLRPGKYRVYAIAAETVAIGLRDPEVLEALKSKSALVTVEEGARVAQDVTLITAEELATALHANL